MAALLLAYKYSKYCAAAQHESCEVKASREAGFGRVLSNVAPFTPHRATHSSEIVSCIRQLLDASSHVLNGGKTFPWARG